MKHILLLLSLASICVSSQAQQTFPVNGVQNTSPIVYAFTNATIVMDPENILTNATLIVKDKYIESIGTTITIPQGAVVVNLKGKYIYPGLIDGFTTYGMPDAPKGKGGEDPQFVSGKKGAFGWNEAVKPEISAKELFSVNDKKADELRKLGFTTVVSLQKDGIVRGSSVVVNLANTRENELFVSNRASSNLSFNKGSSTQDFPSSQMGAIALIRQTYLDAQWYKTNRNKVDENISLDAFNEQRNLPVVFEVDDVLEVLRADRVGDEFAQQYIIKGAGDEYQRVEEVKKTGATLIIPINFPKAYDVEDPDMAMQIGLAEMKHWELAPSNPAALEKAGVPFMITATAAKDQNEFWKNMRLAVEYGLSEKQALRALTVTPAQTFKVADKVGMLRKGYYANFIITSDKLFGKKTEILENWVQGQKFSYGDVNQKDLRGTYDLTVGGNLFLQLKLSGEAKTLEANVVFADTAKKSKATLTLSNDLVTLFFDSKDKENKGDIRLSGYIAGANFEGAGELPNGKKVSWKAVYKEAYKAPKEKTDSNKYVLKTGKTIYPFTAYGSTNLPKQERTLIKNTTVWTNEAQGRLEGADVLIDGGKIVLIGRNLPSAGVAKTIDGTNKHLTAGIIDEHSHIAISKGVNDIQTVSSEVRIGDVLNSEDVNIYRQLAGGVTTSHLLHGSANAIGGQTALIKLRWGKSPQELKFAGADGFIKFALGENVKQSNWGDRNTTRFPQTRMGVEQVYIDAFTRAKEYQKALYASPSGTRRDLELDALLEILNKKRFITCHSYVQSEINMLMHVADSMGFTVNTFTHILEGYKVADKMKKHGAAASTFSDWWAYKFEVIDAIPYNAALMQQVGLNVAINSDDAEMARRLNQEAAKIVKYGNVSEEDALKMVTLNPAKMLHIDNKVGSIKVGKDADLVIWNNHPLSVYAKPEKTFVDGIAYFDAERDVQLREEMHKERARLIQKMMEAKLRGEKTQKPGLSAERQYHCDTYDDEAVAR